MTSLILDEIAGGGLFVILVDSSAGRPLPYRLCFESNQPAISIFVPRECPVGSIQITRKITRLPQVKLNSCSLPPATPVHYYVMQFSR
jgi:hypothetical protein